MKSEETSASLSTFFKICNKKYTGCACAPFPAPCRRVLNNEIVLQFPFFAFDDFSHIILSRFIANVKIRRLFTMVSLGFVNLYIVPVIVSVSILFYSILLCYILFYSILFYFIRFCSILFYTGSFQNLFYT